MTIRNIRAVLRAPSGSPVDPTGLNVRVNSYSHRARGGPYRASISAFGSAEAMWQLVSMMRYDIEVYDWRGVLVWWGYIHGIELHIGATIVGVSLDNVSNRVQVLYSFRTATGDERRETEWAQDEVSQGLYGTIEEKVSVGSCTDAAAERSRNIVLDTYKLPVPLLEFSEEAESALSARLDCRGYYETLDWKYDTQPTGTQQMTRGGRDEWAIGGYVTTELSGGGSAFDWWKFAGQRFTFSGTTHQFRIEEVHLRLEKYEKEGWSGTWDNFQAQICPDASGWPDYTNPLFTWEVQGSEFPDEMDWYAFKTTSAPWCVLEPDTDYWLFFRRKTYGGSKTEGTYDTHWVWIDAPDRHKEEASGDYEEGYAYSWWNLSPGQYLESDLPFRIIGTWETSTIMTDIIDNSTQFVSSYNIQVSGVYTSPIREGDRKAQSELETLMNEGTSNGRRYVCNLDINRHLTIEEEAEPPETSSDCEYFVDSRGILYNSIGHPLEMQECPVGIWVTYKDVPVSVGVGSNINVLPPIYLDETVFNAQANTCRFVPRGRPAPLTFARLVAK